MKELMNRLMEKLALIIVFIIFMIQWTAHNTQDATISLLMCILFVLFDIEKKMK